MRLLGRSAATSARLVDGAQRCRQIVEPRSRSLAVAITLKPGTLDLGGLGPGQRFSLSPVTARLALLGCGVFPSNEDRALARYTGWAPVPPRWAPRPTAARSSAVRRLSLPCRGACTSSAGTLIAAARCLADPGLQCGNAERSRLRSWPAWHAISSASALATYFGLITAVRTCRAQVGHHGHGEAASWLVARDRRQQRVRPTRERTPARRRRGTALGR